MGPAFARHARTEARDHGAGRRFSPCAARRPGGHGDGVGELCGGGLAKRFGVGGSDQAAGIERASRSAFVTIRLSMAQTCRIEDGHPFRQTVLAAPANLVVEKYWCFRAVHTQ